MRSSKHIIALFSFLFFSFASFAQNATSESIPVNGNCGMCKKKIEGAAKDAGATAASWDEKSKVLTVSYDGAKTSNMLIQQAVAKSGYDTRDVKATADAYKTLPSCCQYDRKQASATDGKSAKCCDKADCGKDDKACKDKCCDGKTCKSTAMADDRCKGMMSCGSKS
jgi:hypothetical protein